MDIILYRCWRFQANEIISRRYSDNNPNKVKLPLENAVTEDLAMIEIEEIFLAITTINYRERRLYKE